MPTYLFLGATSMLQCSKCPLLAYWAHFHPLPVSAFSIWPQPCVLLLQATEETKRENNSHQDKPKWGEGIGFSLANGSFLLCWTLWLLFNTKYAHLGHLYGVYFYWKATERAFMLIIGVHHGCMAASWLSELLECGVVWSICSASSWGCYRFVALWRAFNMSARGNGGYQCAVWFTSLTNWA